MGPCGIPACIGPSAVHCNSPLLQEPSLLGALLCIVFVLPTFVFADFCIGFEMSSINSHLLYFFLAPGTNALCVDAPAAKLISKIPILRASSG